MRQHRAAGGAGSPRITFWTWSLALALAVAGPWVWQPRPAAAQALRSTSAPPPPGSARPGRAPAAPAAPSAPDPALQKVPGQSPSEGGRLDQDLITRYRFSERYGSTNIEIGEDGQVGQYKVAIKEMQTIKDLPGKPAATAPGRAPTTRTTARAPAAPVSSTSTSTSTSGTGQVAYQDKHIIYTERAAEVSALGQVKTLIRRHERARLNNDPNSPYPPGSHPIEGLTVWYRPQVEDWPQVLSLTTNRELLESEYRFIAEQLFVPDIVNLLPPSTVRIGDTWPISKLGVKLLVGADRVAEGGLIGKLTQIRRDPRGSDRDRVAVMDVSGQMRAQRGQAEVQMRLHAQLEFAFALPRPREGENAKASELATIDARGAIVWLSMVVDGVLSYPQQPSRSVKRELVLERQLANTGVPLEIPRDPPRPITDNSWLTYVDPQKRFEFRHPQEMHHPLEYQIVIKETPDRIELMRFQHGGGTPDRVTIEFSADSKRDPEEARNAIVALGKKNGFEGLQGPFGWLPDVDWPGMKVYRSENAFLTKGRGARGVQRIHFDTYVIYFTGRNSSLVVTATTAQDPPLQLRHDVEEMLKTFEWIDTSSQSTAKASSDTAASTTGTAATEPPQR